MRWREEKTLLKNSHKNKFKSCLTHRQIDRWIDISQYGKKVRREGDDRGTSRIQIPQY